MISSSGFLDSVLWEINVILGDPNLKPHLRDMILNLKVELQSLELLFTCVANMSDAADEENLRSHAARIDQEITRKITKASSVPLLALKKNNENEKLQAVITDMQEKMELLRPATGNAYEGLVNYGMQFSSGMSYSQWMVLVDSIQNNLKVLLAWKSDLVFPVKKQILALSKRLMSLDTFIFNVEHQSARGGLGCSDHRSPLGAVAIRAAQISYLCSVNEMDENRACGIKIMLSDLHQRIKPLTPESMDMYLTIVKTDKGMVPYLINFLLANVLETPIDGVKLLHEGLVCLMTFYISAPEDYKMDVKGKQTLGYIIGVAREARSISDSFDDDDMTEDKVRELNLALFKLLAKIELLKAELYLLAQMLCKNSLTVATKDPVETFHNGLKFLERILRDAPKENAEKGKLMLAHIEAVSKNLESLFHSYSANKTTSDIVKDELVKLLKKIKLFKVEAFCMELLNCNTSQLVHLKDQIEILHEGLIIALIFLMDPPKEDTENGELILIHIEAVARKAIFLYHSCHCFKKKHLVREMMHLLPDLIEKVKLVKAELNIYLKVPRSSWSNFPTTDCWGFVDSLLENLRELLIYMADSIAFMKHQIEVLRRELEFLRSALTDNAEHCNGDQELKDIGLQVINLAYEAEYVLNLVVLRNAPVLLHTLWLSDVIEDLKYIKRRATKIYEKNKHEIGHQNVTQTPSRMISQFNTARMEEVVVGLNDEAETMIDRLTRGSLEKHVISIVGMAGIGKTTLAKKVYNDPRIQYHFHIRAWCCVSQVYQKRDLLLDILSCCTDEELADTSEDDLAEVLYKYLKGNRYLIVMDDLWDTGVLDHLTESFPNDENGSRILLTSRLNNVALISNPDIYPYPLCLLSDDESCKLLMEKVFHKAECPQELIGLGEKIARYCRGLPLAVVAIAGLLERADKTPDRWEQVARNLSSRTDSDLQRQCMGILELSYKHLPDYLKPCFLYFGAFPEDKEIPVWKLRQLWIAEGFIHETDRKSLGNAAEEYIMDLIARNLVMVSKIRSHGGVKACIIHDMLRDLCLAKAKEENFLQLVSRYDKPLASSSYGLDYGVDPDSFSPKKSIICDQRRLCIHSKRQHFIMSRPSGPRVSSLLFSATNDMRPTCPYDISFILSNMKVLRVLDLECLNLGDSFPQGVEFLLHLRYLAVSGDITSVPSSIVNLRNLETFRVKGLRGNCKIVLPDTIWRMPSLRHVQVNSKAAFSQESELMNCPEFVDILTLSAPCFSSGQDAKILRRLTRLQKLKCVLLDQNSFENQFLCLDFLTRLHSLKIFNESRRPCGFNFPLNLKKLTLLNFPLSWEYVSEIGTLPNLEVLKLIGGTLEEGIWDMKDGEFLKLKFLKLDTLHIAKWNSSTDNFPCLQQLVLRRLRQLDEVPCIFGDIPTLQMIEVQWCSKSAASSVRKIQEAQQDAGNEVFKVLVMPQE